MLKSKFQKENLINILVIILILIIIYFIYINIPYIWLNSIKPIIDYSVFIKNISLNIRTSYYPVHYNRVVLYNEIYLNTNVLKPFLVEKMSLMIEPYLLMEKLDSINKLFIDKVCIKYPKFIDILWKTHLNLTIQIVQVKNVVYHYTVQHDRFEGEIAAIQNNWGSMYPVEAVGELQMDVVLIKQLISNAEEQIVILEKQLTGKIPYTSGMVWERGMMPFNLPAHPPSLREKGGLD